MRHNTFKKPLGERQSLHGKKSCDSCCGQGWYWTLNPLGRKVLYAPKIPQYQVKCDCISSNRKIRERQKMMEKFKLADKRYKEKGQRLRRHIRQAFESALGAQTTIEKRKAQGYLNKVFESVKQFV
ncbi:MAG: hypothetical protein HY204_12435 [Nitrospirae bacterium]|nr:hypothetical protein [Nitrospirota bacterium]